MATTIWVDADACPRAVKDVLFRAAEKRKVQLILIANQFIRTPPSPFISSIQVPAGFDVADNAIVERLAAFAAGLGEDQDSFAIKLLGGDTTRTSGPLALSLTVVGSYLLADAASEATDARVASRTQRDQGGSAV